MKIGIIGAGALGSLFGAYLHEGGHTVHLVDIDTELVETISERGVIIEDTDGNQQTYQLPATTKHDQVGMVDLLFVFVKIIHTEAAIRDAEPLIDDETIVVTLQNGFDNMEIIGEYVPADRVLGGPAMVGSQLKRTGHYIQTSSGPTKVGGGSGTLAEDVATLLSEVGLHTEAVDSAERHIWNKQLATLGTKPVSALTGLTVGSLIEFDRTALFLEKLIREGVDVASAKGIEPIEDPVAVARENCRTLGATKPSMLEDIEMERRTEIDHINGAIVRHGRELGVPVPCNEQIVALVKGKEQSYLGD